MFVSDVSAKQNNRGDSESPWMIPRLIVIFPVLMHLSWWKRSISVLHSFIDASTNLVIVGHTWQSFRALRTQEYGTLLKAYL